MSIVRMWLEHGVSGLGALEHRGAHGRPCSPQTHLGIAHSGRCVGEEGSLCTLEQKDESSWPCALGRYWPMASWMCVKGWLCPPPFMRLMVTAESGIRPPSPEFLFLSMMLCGQQRSMIGRVSEMIESKCCHHIRIPLELIYLFLCDWIRWEAA